MRGMLANTYSIQVKAGKSNQILPGTPRLICREKSEQEIYKSSDSLKIPKE
jgi:hypothetical protein